MADAFDENALVDRVDGDLEFLEETIAMLDEDAPGLLEAIQAAAAAGDAEALVKPAHALKGMLANFCAPPAETAAREVETLARQGQLAGVGPAIETLRRQIEHLKDALHRFLKARSS